MIGQRKKTPNLKEQTSVKDVNFNPSNLRNKIRIRQLLFFLGTPKNFKQKASQKNAIKINITVKT